MMKLADLVASHEDWLMHKVLTYAKENGYTRHTSTLAEAWRTSISGLSQSIQERLKNQPSVPELLPDEDHTSDPIASFGIIEAQRHRKRGVSLGMFLGLMKYYRQSYIDLIAQAGFGIEEERLYRLFVDRFFDRIELGFCTEWNSLTENQTLVELQSANRCMTNEKNKYLTIFESIGDPIFLFDKENRIENMNHAASELFFGISIPGSTYYDKQKAREVLPWIEDELAALDASGQMEVIFEKQVITSKGIFQFQVKIKQMLDVSEKFSGKVVILNDITERKRAEEALRESELRLRIIFDASSAGIVIVDTEGRITQANRQMAELFACSLETLIGTPYPAFVHPDERQKGTRIMQAMMENKVDTVHTERHYLRKDGSDFWGYLNGRRMVGSNGEFTGLLGIISDITDRKRTEDELRWKTALLEAQVEASSDGILVVDNQGQRIITNQQLLTMWKVPSHISNEKNDEALLQYVVGKTKNPDQFLEKVMYLYGHKDETSRDEIEFKDGIVLDRYSSPVIGRDGKHYGRIWIFHDITDYKHVLEALCESERRLADIINFLPDATLVIDKEGKVIAWNRAIEAMTGIKAEDILGKGNYEYALPFYGERRPILIDLVIRPQKEVEERYVDIVRRDRTLIGESYAPNLKGGEVYFLGSAAALYDSEGNIAGAIESIRDITERRNIERKLANESNKFKVMYDLALNMSAEKSLDENMTFIVDKSRELLNTDTSYIALLDETGRDVRMHTLSGIRTEAFKQMHLPLGKGLYGLVMETHKGYIVDDYFKNKDIKHVVDGIIADEGLITGMAVPVQIRDKSLGVLYAFNRRKTSFTQEDLDTLALLGNLAAVEIVRKRSSNALEGQLNFLQQLIDAIPNPIFYKDTKGVYLGCNTAFESFTGLTKDKMVGKTVYEVYPKDLADIYYKADNSLFQNLGVQIYETAMVHADGTRRNVMSNKAAYFDTKGRLAGLVGIIQDITERKQAEDTLRETRNYLENLFDHANAPIIVWDTSFRITRFNHAFEHLIEYTAEEVIGQRLDILFPESSREASFSKIERTLAGEYWESVEVPILHKDGSIRIVLWNSANIYAEDGKMLLATMAQGTDITERKQVEEHLRRSREKYHNIFENSTLGLYQSIPEGRYLSVNPAFAKFFGFNSPEEMITSVTDIGHQLYVNPQDRDRAIKILVEQGFLEGFELEARRKDGTTFWLSMNTRIVQDENGLHFDGTVEDITKRKRAEEAIKESQRRLADIINFLPDATLVIDKEGKVIAWNRAIEAMTGIKAEEILGKDNYEYALPFYGERRPILIDLVLKPQEEIEKGYTDLRRQDGTLVGGAYMPTLKGGGIFLVGSAAALYDSEGNISGAIESIRDITENKHAEEALRRAKEEAESATRAKSEFLANMSHEIRTPMNAVIGMTGLLLGSDLNPDQRECVEIIHSSGEALLSIINDILDYSKVEEGKGELESQPFNLRECIESSMDLIASKAAEKGLRLTCAVDDKVPENLMGDVTRLRQVLVNLLSNAVKFTNAGKVSITVTSQQKRDRYEICFTVRDTGIGIPPERMNRLFRSFSQVDMSTTRKYGGTGLGLAISKRLVEMMGGKIWVESEVGIGSAFHFIIVAESVPAGRIVRRPVSQPQAGQPASPPASLRLLLAEDNVVNQKVALRMLKKIGYRADVAANGLEVLKAMERQKYDVILMDVQMPEMDGLEAARAIRHLPQERQPKIIAITAYALEGDREKCLEAGMDDYISKPVQMGELAEVLSKYRPSQTGT